MSFVLNWIKHKIQGVKVMVFGLFGKSQKDPQPVVPEKAATPEKEVVSDVAETVKDTVQPVAPPVPPQPEKSNIDKLEDQLSELLNKVDDLKSNLITEISDKKNDLINDLSSKKLDEFNLENGLGVQKNLLNTFEKQKTTVEKKKNQGEDLLAKVLGQQKDLQEEIDSVDKRIDRLHRLIAIDQEKIDLKQANHYVDRELLKKVTERQGTLLTVEQEQKILMLDMQILKEKEEQLKAQMQKENQLLDSMAANISSDISAQQTITQQQAQKYQQVVDNIKSLSAEKDKMDGKLEKLVGRRKYLIEKSSKGIDFGVILPALPGNLQSDEAASLQVWNNVIYTGANLHLFSIEMNPEAKAVYDGYLKRGIFSPQMAYHNVYFDLLEWDEANGEFGTDFQQVEEGDNLTPIVTATGLRVGVRRVEGNKITEEFRNPAKNHSIVYTYVDEKLDSVRYDDMEFMSEREFLVYWMTRVTDHKKIRLVVSSNSELPIYDAAFAKEGINIIPLITEAEDMDHFKAGSNQDELNEVMVFGDDLLDALAEKVQQDTVVYKLPTKITTANVSPDIPEKVIVMPEL